MDFELNTEQMMYRDSIRSFVNKEVIPVAREWEHAGRYPAEIVDEMAKMGLFGVTIPASYDGLGLDLVSMALVFEEIARGWMGIAGIIGSHSLACHMIVHHGTEDQRTSLLPELASGRRRTGIALTEPSGGSDLQEHRDTRPPGRRPLCRARHEDLDHERPPR